MNDAIEFHARVLAVLQRGYIEIVLAPDVGLADGGIPIQIAIELVPLDARMPNTELLVKIENGKVVSVRKRL